MSVQTTEFSSTRKRQSMAPGSVIVQKTQPGSGMSSMGRMSMGGGTTIRRNVVQSTYSMPTRATGEAGKVSKESVANVMNSRGKEKKDLGDLNSKLANYIDKVKYMEACNKAMTEEIDRLRKMKGYSQDRVKDEYEAELQEARESIKTLSKEIAPLQAKILALEDKVESNDQELNMVKSQKDDLYNQVLKLTQMVGEYEGELNSLRGRLEAVDKENNMLKQDNGRLRDDNDRVRCDFEAAVTKQINAENERDCIDEELQFIKESCNLEIEELRELLNNFKSVQPDIQKMWNSEFKDCISAIQLEYNDQLARMTDSTERRCQERISSMENAYRRDDADSSITKSENKTLKSQVGNNKSKVATLEGEIASLRRQLDDLRREHEEMCEECEEEKQNLKEKMTDLNCDLTAVMDDLNVLRSTNMGLELEIACYRKMLEGEENSMKRIIEDQQRVQSQGGADLASMISGGGGRSGGGGGGGGGSSSQQSTMSESTGMVRVSKSSKCSVSFKEVSQDGSHCVLENTSTNKDFDLGNWNLERGYKRGTRAQTAAFKFPAGFKLGPRKTLKIFSYDCREDAGADDLVGEQSKCASWGTGNGDYKLIDEKNNKDDAKAAYTLSYSGR